MTVSQLIKHLEKMPQNLIVGFSHHDNDEFEIASYVSSVDVVDKRDYKAENSCADRRMVISQPDVWVILRG